MPNEPRIQTRDILLTAPEPQYRAAQEAATRVITPSTVTTTGFVLATLTSTCVGNYVVPLEGNARGQVRQVKSFVLATTTATVDTPWTDITGVVTVANWLPAEVPVRSTATGTTTTVVSSLHANITNEPDNFITSPARGAFLLAKSGSNAGGAYQLASSTSTTGTFTTTPTMGAAGGDGNLYLLRTLLRPEAPVAATMTHKTVARRIVGYKSADAAVPVTTESTVELQMAQRPLTASAGSTIVATPPQEISNLLLDHMTETLDTGSTVSSATSTTVVAASGTGFSIGGFLLLATGEATQILNKATNTLTVQSGTITSTVAASSTVFASSWYKFKTSDFRTRTFDFYRGALYRQVFHGSMPTIEIAVARDQVIKFGFKYTCAEGIEYNIANPITLPSTFPIPLLDTTVPVDGKGARLCIDGVNVICGDMKVMLGLKPILRQSLSGINQADGYAMDVEPASVTFTALADNDDIASFKDLIDRLHGGDVVNFLYQKGGNPKETFCIGIPALQLTKAVFSFNNGQGEFQCEGQAIMPQAVRGNSFASTLESFAIGWL